MDREWLQRVSVWKRRDFFKGWNQLQTLEEAFLPLEEKLEFLKKHIPSLLDVPAISNLPLGIRFVSMLDDEYPEAFFELPQPPLGLFVQGNLGQSVRAGVIGSRKPLPYSRRLTREVTAI
ncbi:MAG: DNA-protecting protein DprA, partial [Bacteriovoracaceae bacterium]|nr:DNA-protecting protein DprA [Bacteriovoracaceae bacterium]